ncbi:hypothetical protein SORBI_3007G081400 [Sorghum bicolor]|uniref:Uncharacterized protein n=1 Tax=Sorghum bicolor TaxID=4558 RepID=C5YIZ1_SORBI|nr:hypothetical protein SORBI_3007G081400 [Sorghum bicolor]
MRRRAAQHRAKHRCRWWVRALVETTAAARRSASGDSRWVRSPRRFEMKGCSLINGGISREMRSAST